MAQGQSSAADWLTEFSSKQAVSAASPDSIQATLARPQLGDGGTSRHSARLHSPCCIICLPPLPSPLQPRSSNPVPLHLALPPASDELALTWSASRAQWTALVRGLQLLLSDEDSTSGTGKYSESGYGVWANQLTNSHSLRAIFNSETNSSASASDDENDVPPAGCNRIKVELKKLLGIAFEEDEFGRMFAGEVIGGGNADKSGLVDAGDQLMATSAIVYGSEEEYQGVMVRKGMQKIRLNVRGERFETVIAAIGTHPYYIKVEMEFQKCKPVPQDSLNGSTRN